MGEIKTMEEKRKLSVISYMWIKISLVCVKEKQSGTEKQRQTDTDIKAETVWF